MKNILLLILALCVIKTANAQQYTIKAHVTGFPNGTKFYLTDIDVSANIDSALIKDDHFVLSGKLYETPKSLWIQGRVGTKFFYTTLLIGNENINISGDIKDFPFDLAITGSKIQDDHNTVNNLIKADYKKRNELVEEYFALKNDSGEVKGKKIWKVIGKIDSTDNASKKAFIAAHLNSYEGLFQLFYLKNQYPKDTLAKMYNSLTPEFKQHAFGQRIGNYLKVGSILKKGDMTADFEAQDKNGQQHRLSDMKGKYILLDFSTTYCGPCMQSLEDLNLIAKKYAGLVDIVTFSGDGGKETWLTGVKRDKPTWTSLWDGKGNYSETILKYGVTGYPTFFLVDAQGKIVEKWVGYGKNPDGRGSLITDLDKHLANKIEKP